MSSRRGAAPPTIDPRDIAPALERVEMDAAGDMVFAAPPDIAQECGLAFEAIGNAAAQVATRIDTLMFNRAMGLGIARVAGPNDLDAVLAYLASSGVPRFMISVCPFARPQELGRWLTDRGLERHNQWAKLWRDASPPKPVNTAFVIEKIDKYQAVPFGRIVSEVYGIPENFARWAASTVGRAGWSHYMAFDRATAVAVGALFVSGDLGYLALAATKPSHRGQGAQHALIAARIRDAQAQGCKMLAVETAEDTPTRPAPSYNNLLSMGFKLAYLRPNYLWKRA